MEHQAFVSRGAEVRSPTVGKTDDFGGGRPPVRSTSNTMDSKVNLDGSSANDNPGSRDFSTSNQQASSDTHASRVSLILVTRDLLDKPTGEVTNTMDKDSFGTFLTDDPGGGDLNAGLWWTDVDCAVRSYVHDCGG